MDDLTKITDNSNKTVSMKSVSIKSTSIKSSSGVFSSSDTQTRTSLDTYKQIESKISVGTVQIQSDLFAQFVFDLMFAFSFVV